ARSSFRGPPWLTNRGGSGNQFCRRPVRRIFATPSRSGRPALCRLLKPEFQHNHYLSAGVRAGGGVGFSLCTSDRPGRERGFGIGWPFAPAVRLVLSAFWFPLDPRGHGGR